MSSKSSKVQGYEPLLPRLSQASRASQRYERLLPRDSQRSETPSAFQFLSCSGASIHAYRRPLTVVAWVTVGALAFMYIEGFGAITSLYVIAQIVTTVGYGDVTVEPSSQTMKLFLAFYVLFGVFVAADLAVAWCDGLLVAAENRAGKKMREIEARLMDGGALDETWWESHKAEVNRLVADFGLWIVCCLIGVLYFGCIDTCKEDLPPNVLPWMDEACPSNKHRTLVDAFYMCCITLTTIGFGDEAPQARLGRGVATVWMLFGCAATANLIASFSAFGTHARRKLKALDKDMYNDMEKDEQGRVHKWQFLQFMLLRYNLASKDDIDFIMGQFGKLDIDNDGFLTLSDLPCVASGRSKMHKAVAKCRMMNALKGAGDEIEGTIWV